MGRLSEKSGTLVLLPCLLEHRTSRAVASISGRSPSIAPGVLWIVGLFLATYPMWTIVMKKCRNDFRDDWWQSYEVNKCFYSENATTTFITSCPPFSPRSDSSYQVVSIWIHGALLFCLDKFALCVVDICPRIASSLVVMHIGFCIAYYLRFACNLHLATLSLAMTK